MGACTHTGEATRCASRLRASGLCPDRTGGLAAVEFALLLAVLVPLLMGVIDLGRLAYIAVQATNAARAGVQYAAQSQLTSEPTSANIALIKTATQNDAPSDIAASMTFDANTPVTNWQFCACSLTPATTGACSTTVCSGTLNHLLMYARVRITVPYNAWLPYPAFVGWPSTLTGQAVMQVNQ
jgi:Flp pilus assembly protein TadG